MSRRAVGRLAFGVLLALSSCTKSDIELAPHLVPRSSDDAGIGDPIANLQSLRITPDSREVTFDGAKLDGASTFRAFGKFPSGERDVTDRVEWSLSEPDLGAIADGRFASAALGGTATVTVRAGDVRATARLQVRLDIVRTRGVEARLIAAFAANGATVRAAPVAPQLAYPSDGVVFPRNIAHVHYQWRAPEELDCFELQIDSEVAKLRYYTTDRDWLDDIESSRFFAPSHPGESITVRVRALASESPEVIYRSDEVTLRVADLRAEGAVLYWSSTARGIKRGELGWAHATRVVTDPAGAAASQCTGCHAISRDGKQLAVADDTDRLAIFEAPDWEQQSFVEPTMRAMDKGPKAMMPMAGGPPMPPMPPMPMPMPPKPRPAPEYAWGSFSPDGARLAYAAKGKLHILDTVTGLETSKAHSPPDTSLTHPDWSPDGSFIAVAYAPGKPAKSDKLVRASSSARLRVLEDGSLGEPEIVASAGADDTLAFPVHAPNGRVIAFARAVGASKDNPSAELWLVAADGSSAPVRLDRANQAGASNTMPTWAPVIAGSHALLAFSSARDYGTGLNAAKRDQLWATVIDLERAASGVDASAPAFWLPFQDLAEHNHRALWAVAGACIASAEICDGRDTDCDGAVDESCCTPSPPEDCSDSVDNDCDGVANEGCECEETERCGDGRDDDCDAHVDEDCDG